MTDAITGTISNQTYNGSITSIASGSARTSAPKQEMDSEMFLKLLITQMQNQDPSNPMDSSQMVQQTSSLAQMEQLTEMSDLTSESFGLQMRNAAAALIGKQVSYTDADGKDITGTATAVSYKDSTPKVTVNGVQVNLDVISGVTN
ncbi:flagellar hook assembly protein FlgD [Leifsonia sp. Leaf264]|uniref:flagellar hook assembly protein FlgD n=1 Tax=Leifsonia sp. Leaf264 TaxID=1736314 RepID=UPI0007001CE5|nr:flagellar hook capping FlgD N-terminal domain-containing protein [Leifsonia sp. Leaf264]KQO98239.1 flagellar hook capping protein [Leifsonia sp. Leaf264]